MRTMIISTLCVLGSILWFAAALFVIASQAANRRPDEYETARILRDTYCGKSAMVYVRIEHFDQQGHLLSAEKHVIECPR